MSYKAKLHQPKRGWVIASTCATPVPWREAAGNRTPCSFANAGAVQGEGKVGERWEGDRIGVRAGEGEQSHGQGGPGREEESASGRHAESKSLSPGSMAPI